MYKNLKDTQLHPILNKRIKLRKRFTNFELELGKLFFEITKVVPTNIISLNPYYLFFIPERVYLKAKFHLKRLRRTIKRKKIVLIRENPSLLTLLINFFPEVYIHNIKVIENKDDGKLTIKLIFVTSEELAIAIGREGDYIKLVNSIIQKYIKNIEIKCEIHYL